MRFIFAFILLLAPAQAQNVRVSGPIAVFGDLMCAGPDVNSIYDCQNTITGKFTAGSLQLNGNITYSGASGPANSWIIENGLSISGVASNNADGFISPNHLFISSDTVNTTTSGGGFLSAFLVAHRTSAGSTGGRTAIEGFENITGTPTTLTAAGYLGILSQTRVGATLGGATGVYTNYIGTAFGGNSNIFTVAGATFLSIVNGHEFDVTLATGSSAAEKHGISIVQGANDAIQGVYDDSAIDINNQSGASTGWNYAISIGDYAHLWPLTATSTIIGAQIRQTVSSSPIALNGVDFRNVAFQAGGVAFASTGYNIDPSGNATANSFQLGGTSSASGNEFYLSATNAPAVAVNGVFSQSWGVNSSLFSVVNNGTATYNLRNTQTLSSAAMQLNVGNNTSGAELSLTVNGSANVGGNGANSSTITGVGGLWLQGGTTNGFQLDASGNPFLPSVTTGTPTASLCINSSNQIIKKTTTGACV